MFPFINVYVASDRLKICVGDCAIMSDEILRIFADILSKPVVLPMTLGN